MQEKEQILTWITNQKQVALAQITSGIQVIANVKNVKPRLNALIHEAQTKRDSYQTNLDALTTNKDNKTDAQIASLKLLLNYYIKQAEQIINTTERVLESNDKEATNTEEWVSKSRQDLQKWLTEQETSLIKRLHQGEAMVLEWQSNITTLQQLYRSELQKQLSTRLAIARLDMSTQLSRYTTDLHQQTRLQTQMYQNHPGLSPSLATPDLPSIDSLAFSISRPDEYDTNNPYGSPLLSTDQGLSSLSAPLLNSPPFTSSSASPYLHTLYDGGEVTPASLYQNRAGGNEGYPQMPLLPAVPLTLSSV